jgi:predicted nucleotide-binding protein
MTGHTQSPVVDRDEIERFLLGVPNHDAVVANHRKLIEHFVYYITAIKSETVATVATIRACYAAAAVKPPANISDILRKSDSFVRQGEGYQIHRTIRLEIEESLRSENSALPSHAADGGLDTNDKSRNVVVVYGRDLRLRDAMFQFLLALRLNPVDWNEAVSRTRKGSPFTGEVVEALFVDAQAIVVILSPDEQVRLRRDLRAGGNPEEGWQPRPNVFVEAGMALAKDEARTILVEVGIVRSASDLHGRNVIRLDRTSGQRNSLVQRLRTAGCKVNTTNNDWLSAGDFQVRAEFFLESEKMKNGTRTTKKAIPRRRGSTNGKA